MNDLWDRFWAHLETLFEETDITVGQPLDNAAATAFISCAVSLILAALTAYFGYLAYKKQRNLSRKQIRARMAYEVADTIRHVTAGLKILEQADSHRVLSTMHFEKMKISEQSLFFDAEMIHHYPPKYDRIFRKCALLLRNNDIELDAIIAYVKGADQGHGFDISHYNDLVGYYMEKSRMLISYLHHELCLLVGCNCKKCIFQEFVVPSSLREEKKGIYAIEGLYDEDGLCQVLPQDVKKRIMRYRHIPVLSSFMQREITKKYILDRKSPDSTRSIVYRR